MDIVEAFVLFAIMIITFYFLGLLGLAILGLIIILVLKLPKPKGRQKKRRREPDKPCYPHGLVNCPFCHPEKQEKENNDS